MASLYYVQSAHKQRLRDASIIIRDLATALNDLLSTPLGRLNGWQTLTCIQKQINDEFISKPFSERGSK